MHFLLSFFSFCLKMCVCQRLLWQQNSKYNRTKFKYHQQKKYKDKKNLKHLHKSCVDKLYCNTSVCQSVSQSVSLACLTTKGSDGPVHETFVFIAYANSEGLEMSLHICAVSPQPLLLALKKRSDVDEGSVPTLSLLRRCFCCC